MAEALARQMFGAEIEVLSAGVEPGGRLLIGRIGSRIGFCILLNSTIRGIPPTR